MGYLPLFLDVTGRSCIVIGGGAVAERKIRALEEARAKVTVISPKVTASIARLAGLGRLRHISRRYREGDLIGAMLAFVATGDEAASRLVAEEASRMRIPVNVADAPELCTFIAPSVVNRGDLRIAISTGGASPATARMLRERIEAEIGPGYAPLLEVMRAARSFLRANESDGKRRSGILRALAASRLRESLEIGDFAAADGIVESLLGVNMASLGIPTPAYPEIDPNAQ
jgi:precorrin-2 dehydrogenase/sirohydrochlorin ferrochelatase